MAGNEIKISVGGDSSGLTKAAKDVTTSSQQMAASLEAAAASASEASGMIASLSGTLQKAATTSGAAAAGFSQSFDEIAAGQAALAKIGASIDAAAEAASSAGQKFDSLGGRLPLADFNEFKKTIDVFKRDISTGFKFNFPPKPIPPALPETFNKTKAGANQAAAALTNIGRVAQDLPFGFVGIQNNLNPLLESFQRLKTETGSSGAALKALGSSLIGAGGIGLALSVVSSAILIFQNGIAGFNSKTKEAKEKADEFAKSIRAIGLVQQEAAAGVEGQIAQVTALAAAVNDSNVPYAQRKRALQELKDINKAYFGDLKLEDAATGALTKTVDEYTKALINNAIQKGFVDEIASVAKAIAKQDEVIRTSRLKLAQASKAVADAENFLPSGTRDIETARAQKRQDAVQKEKEALENLRTENGKVTQLLTQEALVRDQLNKAVLEGTKFKDLDTKGDKKEEDALKKRLEALEKIKSATTDATQLVGIQESIFELQVKIAVRDQGKNHLSNAELDQQIKGFQDELNNAFKKQAIELEAIPKVKFSQVVLADTTQKDISSVVAKAAGLDKKITIPTQFEIDLKLFGKDFADKREEIRKQFAAIVDSIAKGVQDAAVQGSEIIGQAFGELLSGEGVGSALAKAAQGLLGVVGGILQEVGRQIIITSALVKTLKEAISKLFGPGGEAIGLAVGAALIATGALLKNIKFDVPKLAKGGIATSATLGIFGEAGREAIIPLDRLPEMVNKVSVNNQQPIILNGNIRFSGTDLSLMLERVQGRRSRLG